MDVAALPEGERFDLDVRLRFMDTSSSVTLQAAERNGPRRLDDYGLYVIDPGRGCVRFCVNGTETVLRQPSAAVCEPGDCVSLDAGESGEPTLWEFRFDLSWERNGERRTAAGRGADSRRRLLLPMTDFRLARLCLAMEASWRGDALERLRCQSLFQELLYLLLRQARESSGQPARLSVMAAKHYIDRHFRDKLTVGQLAERAGTSQGYFLQLFKAIYACSPIEYMAELRMEEAAGAAAHAGHAAARGGPDGRL